MAGGGTGTVTSNPAGISCGATCGASFALGATVNLTAVPGALSTFAGWSGACAGTGSCAVTLDAAKSVTATFVPAVPPPPRDFYTVTPCRVVDTRASVAVACGVPSVFPVAGVCGVPADAAAVAVNVTAFAPPADGRFTLYPGDATVPATSTLNFQMGGTRANNAIIPLASNASGTLAAQCLLAGGGQAQLIVDVFGYFK